MFVPNDPTNTHLLSPFGLAIANGHLVCSCDDMLMMMQFVASTGTDLVLYFNITDGSILAEIPGIPGPVGLAYGMYYCFRFVSYLILTDDTIQTLFVASSNRPIIYAINSSYDVIPFVRNLPIQFLSYIAIYQEGLAVADTYNNQVYDRLNSCDTDLCVQVYYVTSRNISMPDPLFLPFSDEPIDTPLTLLPIPSELCPNNTSMIYIVSNMVSQVMIFQNLTYRGSVLCTHGESCTHDLDSPASLALLRRYVPPCTLSFVLLEKYAMSCVIAVFIFVRGVLEVYEVKDIYSRVYSLYICIYISVDCICVCM